MSPRRRLALLASGLALLSAGCGASLAERPAHRPISVVYIVGDPAGPFAERTEGLADGAKLAIAESKGIAGERAISVAVVPPVQRDGEQVSAAVGAGRILRDSRTLAVLGTYTAPELALAAPQLNGAETALINFGSGMQGLLAREAPGEPGRYEPSGQSLALRGVPSDAQVARAAVNLTGGAGLQIAVARGASAPASGGSDQPGDADRLAAQLERAAEGAPLVVPAAKVAATATPTVLVIDPSERRPASLAAQARRTVRGTLIVVDLADRLLSTRGLRGSAAPTYLVRRQLAPESASGAAALRRAELQQFGRDRGDAVIAGYRATKRLLALVREQPERTINRATYAQALVADAPASTGFPVSTGQSQLARVQVLELRGTRWAQAR